MKAFVATLALLAASTKAQVLAPFGYSGLTYGAPAYAGLTYGAPIAGAPVTIAGAPLKVAGTPLTYAAAPAPVVAAAPAVASSAVVGRITAPQSSQYHSQDEAGNLNYGYSNINSAKHEAGNTYGGVSGSYSYVDANGIVQTTNYVADALGFRVQATNLPVAKSVPLAQPIHNLVGPNPVGLTPEVAAATEEHLAAVAAASRTKRDAQYLTTPYAYGAYGAYGLPAAYGLAGTYGLPAVQYAAAPTIAAAPAIPAAAVSYAAAAPAIPAVTYAAAAPAGVERTLTKIQNNPGSAFSYMLE